ncbi:glycosyltransferase family 4 protein [Geomonas oryzae]|uniref:glycosyltransferase family 4 protein n=1 Tax=Geomonas oryzae TaxID=2364273 RepID=UPI0013A5C4FF|nr:glycosyltransferase family 4 protein [Geomonas oryzae]
MKFKVECLGGIRRMYPPERIANQGTQGRLDEICLINPAVMAPLRYYRPDLLITNEFSLLSLYAIIYRLLFNGVRVLLVMETRPCFAQNKLISLLRRVLRTAVANNVDVILTNNLEGQDYLVDVLHAPERNIVVRPYVVSDMALMSGIARNDLCKGQPSRKSPPTIRFLFVGRLVELKGLQYVLDGMKLLMHKYRGRFIFDVVGDGPYRENLEQQSHALGLSDHVVFHGKQPYSGLWAWYKEADVFLFPTLGDYRALAPFEAISMALPIIASIHDGGIGETVDEGRNGFSIEPRDTKALVEILSRFLESPAIIPHFSRRSLEIASAYTLDKAVDSLAYACERALHS